MGQSNTPQFEEVRLFATEKLRELPPNLYYHGKHHTLDDVLPAAEKFAAKAGVDGEDLLLLRTAVLFHDMGFIETRQGHEDVGARIAGEVLPGFGYSPEQVETVKDIILATKLPQNPKDILGEIMADADLDSISRDDFFITSHYLRMELMRVTNTYIPVREWYGRQLNFLISHRYFTRAARDLCDEGKWKNIRELQSLASAEG